MEAGESLPCLVRRAALQQLCHQRCRGLGDGTTGSIKVDVLDDVVSTEPQIDVQMITTQGIEALLMPVGCVQRAEIVRLAVVIQDDLLVQFAQL